MVTIRFIGERTDYADRNPMTAPFTDRDRQVLEAVIETYVHTAAPPANRAMPPGPTPRRGEDSGARRAGPGRPDERAGWRDDGDDRRSDPRSPRSRAGVDGAAAARARAAQRVGAADLRGSLGAARGRNGAEGSRRAERAAPRAHAEREPREPGRPAARREPPGARLVR